MAATTTTTTTITTSSSVNWCTRFMKYLARNGSCLSSRFSVETFFFWFYFNILKVQHPMMRPRVRHYVTFKLSSSVSVSMCDSACVGLSPSACFRQSVLAVCLCQSVSLSISLSSSICLSLCSCQSVPSALSLPLSPRLSIFIAWIIITITVALSLYF